jgi:YggT family protein
MRRIVCDLLLLYWLILFVKVLSSWFRRPMSGPLFTFWKAIDAVTDPVLRPLRGMLPPIRAGVAAIDVSPVIAFIAIGILSSAICR